MSLKNKTITYFDQLESTNKHAKENLHDYEDGSVIAADVQTGGRGRLGRSWQSDKAGNVYLSIVLKPNKSLNEYPISNITQYMSVIICELLEKYGIETQIKWPNDVLIDGKKIAGVLSEAVLQGSELKGLIVGAGINLNMEKGDLAKIDKPATSLNLLTDKAIDTKAFIEELVTNFNKEYEDFVPDGFEYIKTRYTQRCAFLGSEILVMSISNEQRGIAKSINSDGTLLLEKEHGVSTIIVGDII